MTPQARQLQVEIEGLLANAAAKTAALAALSDLQPAVVPDVPAAPVIINPANGLKDSAGFYNFLRSNKMLGPKISPSEYQGCEATLAAAAARDHPIAFCAYELATDYHETAHTMQPVDEMGGAAYFVRLYDINGQRPALAKKMCNLDPGDGIKYHGRGKVQLTWKSNYLKAGQRIGVDLVKHPELAKEMDIAARVLVIGSEEGWFTGKRLKDFLPVDGLATAAQFKSARAIINGSDRADLVATYALDFQAALAAGGWVG
jgi:hypothetical protein